MLKEFAKDIGMDFISPPYLTQNVSVRRIMLQVLVALVPAIAVYVWLVGAVVLVQGHRLAVGRRGLVQLDGAFQ